jgi:hypothetical protein
MCTLERQQIFYWIVRIPAAAPLDFERQPCGGSSFFFKRPFTIEQNYGYLKLK